MCSLNVLSSSSTFFRLYCGAEVSHKQHLCTWFKLNFALPMSFLLDRPLIPDEDKDWWLALDTWSPWVSKKGRKKVILIPSPNVWHGAKRSHYRQMWEMPPQISCQFPFLFIVMSSSVTTSTLWQGFGPRQKLVFSRFFYTFARKLGVQKLVGVVVAALLFFTIKDPNTGGKQNTHQVIL